MNRKYDLLLLLLVLILLAIGAVMVYSSSSVVVKAAASETVNPLLDADANKFEIRNSLFVKQVYFVFLAIMAIMLGMYIHLNWVITFSKFLWPVTLILLFLVPFFGKTVKGATRWFEFGGLSFNPAELAKIVLIVVVADMLARKKEFLHDFKQGVLPVLIVIYSLVIGVLFQKDLSSAFVLAVLGFTMLFIAGAKIKHLLAIAGANVLGGILMVFFYSYRLKRIFAFFNPENAESGSLYQAKQSLIAIGNGGLDGVGLGNSYQKYFFLPEAHTDYILAIIGEEWGFIGVMIIIGLFFALFWRGIKIARRAPETFQCLLAWGITLNFIVYALMHMAIVSNFMPSTGLGLPFISYGGSALLSNAILASLLLNVSGSVNAHGYDFDVNITWQAD